MSVPILLRPGSPGAFGALMDEYARAAEEFLAVAEGFDGSGFFDERPSPDPDCRSPRAICEHVVAAAFGYAGYLSKSMGLPRPGPRSSAPATARDVRPALTRAIRVTESAGEKLRAPETESLEDWDREFKVSWGATYNAESLLEHAVVHLCRHRRQLERWNLQ